MSSNVDLFVAANQNYQKAFNGDTDGKKPAPPAKKTAIVTCMDARIHIEQALGLSIGDAHVIRNAGGRVSDDALRSLAISQRLLGTEEIIVIHHTACGMATFDNSHMCGVLKKDLGDSAEAVGKNIDWLTFKDLEESVRDDINIIKQSPLIPDSVAAHGFIYDVSNGGLINVN